MIWTGTLPPPPPPPSHTIPSSTLRSNFQPGDTGEAQFSNLFFLLVGTVVYVGVLGHHRFQRGSWETNRDFGPLDARVFRGVPPSPRPSVPTCVSLHLPPPSFSSPFLPPPTLRPPLISGLRGSRNERSEARWHEEGGGGWVVAGNCSKLRYRDLATLTPLCATPFPVLRSAVPHRRLIYPFVVECLSKIIFDLVCFRIERRENCCAITVENVENASENSIGTIGWNPVVRSPLILIRFDFFVFQG